ncbi:MAG: tRNA 2-thiouridine(34) synthase MnmA [Patescibacteria group bacterium]
MRNKEKGRILVALSGGVDSAVALYLLKKQGYEVEAAFMKNFSARANIKGDCPWKEDHLMAYRVASQLKVPIRTFNFEKQYHQKIVSYIFCSYKQGQTPNPDVLCNNEIKFKLFLDKAIKLGFDKIATGHYAQIKQTKNVYRLYRGRDKNKDQSYFLAGLGQAQLAKSLFPIGHLTKPRVRSIAKRAKLVNADRPDSQGICFIGKINLKDFLAQKIKPKEGKTLNTKGEFLGTHQGVWYYTIGQRQGLNLSGGPWYVVDKNVKKNILTVARLNESSLYKKTIKIDSLHWLGKIYKLPLRAKAQVRYRQPAQNATLYKEKIIFTVRQRGVASGQILVIYKNKELIASATII